MKKEYKEAISWGVAAAFGFCFTMTLLTPVHADVDIFEAATRVNSAANGGTQNWDNLDNIASDDDTRSGITLTTGELSNYFVLTDFGIDLPDNSTITRATACVRIHASHVDVKRVALRAVVGGAAVGSNLWSGTALTTSETEYCVDLNVADVDDAIEATNTGFAFSVQNDNGSTQEAYADYAYLELEYTPGEATTETNSAESQAQTNLFYGFVIFFMFMVFPLWLFKTH